jgi:hypothetical protein
MQNKTPHAQSTTIRAALATLKGNIYQKHLYQQIVLPHHYKNIGIYLIGLSKKNFVHAVSLTQQKNEGRKSRDTVPLKSTPYKRMHRVQEGGATFSFVVKLCRAHISGRQTPGLPRGSPPAFVI